LKPLTTDPVKSSLLADFTAIRYFSRTTVNPNIVTLKFMVAHQPDYINGGHGGVPAGMAPGAMTMIVVGLNNNDQYVLNNRNEVYEHFATCPFTCPGSVNDAYIQ
jgi:hypothetical protein